MILAAGVFQHSIINKNDWAACCVYIGNFADGGASLNLEWKFTEWVLMI
jgi:hypothetical protein